MNDEERYQMSDSASRALMAICLGVSMVTAGSIVAAAINRSADMVAKADAASLEQMKAANAEQLAMKSLNVKSVVYQIKEMPEPVAETDDCRSRRSESDEDPDRKRSCCP